MKNTIYKSRDFLRPHQVVQKRRRQKIVKSILYTILVATILASFVFIMRADFLKIKSIDIGGNVSINADEMSASVSNIISGNYLYVFPKNNILIFPKKEIGQQLAKDFPRIDGLKISTAGDNVKVNITERKPQALWCGFSFAEAMDPCSFVDSSGFVFSKAPQFDGTSYLKFYGGSLATSTDEGLNIAWQLVPPEEYSKIITFISDSKELGLELIAVEITDENSYKFQTKNNGVLIVNRQEDLKLTTNNLKASLSNQILWKKGVGGVKELAQFEYLDLRYGNKVFYKFSGN